MSSMYELVERSFNGHPVKGLLIDGESWLLAEDICRFFGIRNVAQTVERLHAHEKKRGSGTAWFITRFGAYKIAMWSESEKAEPFVDWIAYELIPAVEEQRVARMPGQRTAVETGHLVAAKALNAQLAYLLAEIEQSGEALQRLSATSDEHGGHIVRIDDELVNIKDDIWARKSAIPRKSCRGWAAAARREGRLAVEPSEQNLLRLGRRCGKLCRERKIEKEYVDDDRHDEVGRWPVEILELAAEQLGYLQ